VEMAFSTGIEIVTIQFLNSVEQIVLEQIHRGVYVPMLNAQLLVIKVSECIFNIALQFPIAYLDKAKPR